MLKLHENVQKILNLKAGDKNSTCPLVLNASEI